MKTRCSILVVLMIVVSFAMYQFAMKVAVPYLLELNDGLLVTLGIILGVMAALTIWVGIGEFLMKVLNCREIIDKFIDGAEK